MELAARKIPASSILDMPSDDLGADSTAPVDMAQATQQTLVTTPAFKEPCKKCRGSGRWSSYSGFSGGQCFACKGQGGGFHLFKQSPEKRAQQADYRARKEAEAKAQEQAEKMAKANAWKQANPEAFAWLSAKAPKFNLAADLLGKLDHWGSLTEGQTVMVLRLVEEDKARAAEAQARVASAPAVDTKALEEAFTKALASGLKRVRLTMGDMEVKPAKATSANAGALYVTEAGEYLGKVMGGKFLRVRACSNDQEAKVLNLLQDPKAAAQAYGIETGVCCICNRELTDPVSVAQGIGPICADRFGW